MGAIGPRVQCLQVARSSGGRQQSTQTRTANQAEEGALHRAAPVSNACPTFFTPAIFARVSSTREEQPSHTMPSTCGEGVGGNTKH